MLKQTEPNSLLGNREMISMADKRVVAPNPMKFGLQHTMLRIKDPLISVPFYQNNFNFTLLHTYHFPQWKFSLYFLGILKHGKIWPEQPTKESENKLWKMPIGYSCIELMHNYGSETDNTFQVNNGNVEPYRGFGHLCVMTPNVYESCSELEANGVLFEKKPHEGVMKGLAFALDPDGYWIEIVNRDQNSKYITNKYTLAQTMIRVKDPVKSVNFYRDILKMSLLRERHFSDFSLYYLASLQEGT